MPQNVQGRAWASFSDFPGAQGSVQQVCAEWQNGVTVLLRRLCSAGTQQARSGMVGLAHGHPFWLPEGVCGEGATKSWVGKSEDGIALAKLRGREWPCP